MVVPDELFINPSNMAWLCVAQLCMSIEAWFLYCLILLGSYRSAFVLTMAAKMHASWTYHCACLKKLANYAQNFTYYTMLYSSKTLPIMLKLYSIFIPQFPCFANKLALLWVNGKYLKLRLALLTWKDQPTLIKLSAVGFSNTVTGCSIRV